MNKIIILAFLVLGFFLTLVFWSVARWVWLGVLIVLVLVALWSVVNMARFVKLFSHGNVLVSGMKGRGKDFAFCVVVNARKQNYISNVQYSDPARPYKRFDLDLKVWELSGNTYQDLVSGSPKPYAYPYPDNIDYYISDASIYFPAAYYSELNKKYKSAPVFQSLTRHLGDCCVHCNTQVQSMLWDKIRLQSDTYIVMKGCTHIFGKLFYLSSVVYDNAESAEKQINVPRFGMGKRGQEARSNFEIAHGQMRKLRFFCRLPFAYDSRRFKKILENGCVDYEN